ncbi:L-aspartate oxidase [Membranihabitans maritimus]|uniref:L-aspartate oxidase n=1 Tax=Membranihabitans maritimus TaxID=2904244 RepID=UPI001F020731|nr:L-aspartate oxidase [Membranihabitans maritimus]
MKKQDVLIVGSGVAGMTLAINLAERRPDLKITVLNKTKKGESNTSWAQGGVASVWNREVDDFQKHIEDTLDAGDGLCDPDIVNLVITEGPQRVREMIEWGARFDKEPDGGYDLGREGGHSENRILHFKDKTGWEIQRTILDKGSDYQNITVIENAFAIDLITQHHLGKVITKATPDIRCFGVYVMEKENQAEIEPYLAKVTILATGGAGQVYRNTTNPLVASGDGISMMYRAKGTIKDMEFVQFHPTSLFNPTGEKPDFLISEAVRGYGAELKTLDDKPFMKKYDGRGSLAPRDIVARAIDREMKIHGWDYVYLDCRHLDKEGFINHFPTIYDKCKSLGIDPLKDFIPVTPACHYICGGILVDSIGQSSIQRLYACGEVTCTGLHGANRLASNSLLEGMVFGHRIAEHIESNIDDYEIIDHIRDWDAHGTTQPDEMVLITQSIKELKEIMSSYVGIVRSNVRLKRALNRLSTLYKETEELYQTTTPSPQLGELRNLITIGYLITKSAAYRRESRGLHYNTDYPEKLPYLDHIYL